MSLTTFQFETLHESLKQGQAQFTAALQAAFEGDWALDLRKPTELSKLKNLVDPGLVIKLSIKQGSVTLLIPEGPVLPEWVPQPESKQIEQLEEMAGSLENILFQDFGETNQRATTWSENLSQTINEESLESHSPVITIEAYSESDPSTNQFLYLIVNSDFAQNYSEPSSDHSTNTDFHPSESSKMPDQPAQSALNSQDMVDRVRRILPLTVKVSVRVAEKKIDVAQLANLCPGTLIMFQKSCDDLLDLYVNNQHYAQGEAVKIGEKFGLKVNAVGIKPQRPPGVFTL